MSANPNASKAAEVTSHVSIFPVPPWQLINKYTNTAVAQGTAPPPPAPPGSLTYRMFGNYCNADDAILRSLESQDVRRVYSQTYNRKRELRKLNFSMLANYLDLLDIITRDPSSAKRPEKLDHLAILFINMHHLINEYRPHQARDLLREILMYQVKVAMETVRKAGQYLQRADEILSNAGADLPASAGESFLLLSATHNKKILKPDVAIRADFSDLGPELATLLDCIQDAAEQQSKDGSDDEHASNSDDERNNEESLCKAKRLRVDTLSGACMPTAAIPVKLKTEVVDAIEEEGGTWDDVGTDLKRLDSDLMLDRYLPQQPANSHLDPVLWSFLVSDLSPSHE